jgi:hypothetical protein
VKISLKNKVARKAIGGTIESVKESMYLEAMERPKRPRYTSAKDGFGI